MSSYIGNAVLESASAVPSTPTGNISSTNVQAAINELDTEKSPTTHTHAGVYEPADATILKQVDIGTTANKLVQMDATGKLPAVDGSQLFNTGLGNGQAWQDMTASRVKQTTYTNTTGRIIYLAVESTSGFAINDVQIIVDNMMVNRAYQSNTTACGASGLVPPGKTYSAHSLQPITRWMELR